MKSIIDIKGIVIVVGNYGSGKTEVSINLAVHCKRGGVEVRVADLDLVNPYFRTREAKKTLAELGVQVVTPADQYLKADLPILTPAVSGMIRKPSELTVLDVGGDNVGATVLAALADALEGRAYRMLQVINPFRPYTETVEGCMKIRKEIEAASKLSIDGIVGNANLIDETVPAHIYEGYEFVRQAADRMGLPLEFVTVPVDLSGGIERDRLDCPVLPIERQLVPPWKKAVIL